MMITEGGIERSSVETRRDSRSSLQHHNNNDGGDGEMTDLVHHLNWDTCFGSDPHVDNFYQDENSRPINHRRSSSEQEEWCESPSRQRKQVRFGRKLVSSMVVIKEDEEGSVDALWYSRQEFAKATTELREIVLTARRSQGPQEQQQEPSSEDDPDPALLRGLEDVVSAQALRDRQARLAAVVQGVLQEQARQKEQTFKSKSYKPSSSASKSSCSSTVVVDLESLSKQSELASKSSRDKALRRASLDAMAVGMTKTSS
jgi:hypothetical protein